jgi:hypothetical protein
LPQGVGSNDIGLDRGQLGDTRLVKFERYGNKVLLKQLNTQYRASSSNLAEQASIDEAFADSVIAGFSVMAGDGDVVYSGRGIQGSGDLIIIRHSDRYLSAYAHNSRMLVKEGSRVRAGEKIAEVGENSSGVAMLHFEIREAGDSVDPSRLLPSK